MDGNSRSTEERLADLEHAVHALELRLGVETETSDFGGQKSDWEATSVAPAAFDVVAALTLAGRTLVLLGGAYLLRALTESGVLPAAAGIALGFVYAAVWLGAALRDAPRGRAGSAVTYGLTTTILALPLLFEAVLRFKIIDGASAAAILVVVALAVLAVAVRTGLQPLAWIIVCGAAVTSVA